ncbi:type I-E CRISPR-associated protein Cse1/CasA [Thermobispora bispora]|uniref:type I-E CRISPR-associated protein Cse1/CasA n=1 Tax=Thermobispora bispora TaxID=2006 RepID=UPI0019820055|nr:type I-E CRISPR-associated protein Cse1/CasA [Thermobispora bispora]QSI48080.1 type I-E CRISPR-associated protein Cse1/CasA [Thermobispora bispora]
MRYDLLTRPWLPVRAGDRRWAVGLRELFLSAHELADIEVALPPGASGLWRVLTVIAARVTGLDDVTLSADEWLERREEVLASGRFDPSQVEEYFERYASRFDLFDTERPWLQDPRLREQCPKSSGINKLVLTRPSGNNQVWFTHFTDLTTRSVPTEQAIWHLLAQLYYGPSGRCTSRTVAGTSEANSKAGPLRSTISFHPLGRTVFESLVTSIPCAPEHDHGGPDVAPWEADELPDPLGVPPRPSGIAGVLTGRFQHAILLKPSGDGSAVEDAWITWAWRDRELEAHDPYLIYQQSRQADKPYPRRADANRALWRDFDALILDDVGDEHRRRPAVLRDAEELGGSLLEHLRVRAYGFDQDGQTRDYEWTVAVTPAVLATAKDEGLARAISEMRQAAERVERHLERALRDAWVAINDPSNGSGPPQRKDISAGPWPARGAFRYWSAAERIFWRRVRGRDAEGAADEFLRLALGVYDEVTESAGAHPRVRRAIELNRRTLAAARAAATPERSAKEST